MPNLEITILRHGIAVEHGTPGYRDSERPLTQEGREETRKAAKGLKKAGVRPDLILSSPFVRARETAEIAADVLEAKVSFSDFLASGGDTLGVVREINALPEKISRVMLVGHEPDLSSLISLFLSGDASLAIRLKKAGASKLSAQKPLAAGRCATLHWLLTPRQLVLMA